MDSPPKQRRHFLALAMRGGRATSETSLPVGETEMAPRTPALLLSPWRKLSES